MHETIATLATIPSRRTHVPSVLLSLHGQVDHLHVAFDGLSKWAYEREGEGAAWASEVCDAFERDAWRAPRLHTIHTAHGDLAKLLAVEWTREKTQDESSDTVVLVCDDDLYYPPDYAQRMVHALREVEKHAGGDVLVSLHGAQLPVRAASYRNDRRMVQHCLAPDHFASNTVVFHPAHVLGTGVLAARRRVLTRFLDDDTAWDGASRVRNALDLHLARWAERVGIPRFVVLQPRPAWLKYLLPKDAPTIWSAAEVVKEDALVSDMEWKPL